MLKKIISMIILLFLLMSITFAADAFYRLTHNDHDALIIGTIEEVNDDSIILIVEKQIISDHHLNESAPKKQIELVGQTIEIMDIGHYSYYELDSTMAPIPKVDDLCLVSINKEGLNFKKMWGIYKLKKEAAKYEVLTSSIGSEYFDMDAAALEVFINSNGRINDFSFNGDTKEVYAEGKLIYKAGEKIDTTIDTNIEKNNNETPEKIPNTGSASMFNQTYIMFAVAVVVIVIYRLFSKN